MSTRRTFLASMSALLVPVAFARRGASRGFGEGSTMPETTSVGSADAEFRRLRAQATRAQSRAAINLEPRLDP
jgi:hypothetical protein